ncbi:MAG: hypothetical protein WC533_04595 [Candidatus Pacearchaeota archaeon]
MIQKTLKTSLLLTCIGFLLVLTINLSCASIIWSDPVTTNFIIDSPEDNENECRQIKDKLSDENDYEENLRNKYSDWECINNRLRRSVTWNGIKSYEYGQACGLDLPASETNKNLIWIMPIILVILILIILVLIALVVIRKAY